MPEENCIRITHLHNLHSGRSLIRGNRVQVWIDGECVESKDVPCKERYDKTRMNAVGRLGAIIWEPHFERLEELAREYAEKYNLPVVNDAPRPSSIH